MHFVERITVVLAFLLLAAAGALAQSGTPVTNNYDIALTDQVTINTCSAGEPVVLNGTVHIQASISTDSNGMNYFTFSAANNVTGVGQNTGISYAAADSDDFSSNTSDTSTDITVELQSQLASQGTSPSMALVQRLHITADASGNVAAQIVSNNPSCGN
jgi:hypothetical protein